MASAAASPARRLASLFSSTKPRARPPKPAAPAQVPKAPPGQTGSKPHKRRELAYIRRILRAKSILKDIFRGRDPDKIVSRFIAKSTASKHFRNEHRVYEATVAHLTSVGRYDAIAAIMDSQKPFIESSNVGFAVRLVRLCGRASMPSHAAAIFHALPPKHKSVMTFNVLLAAYVDAGDFDALTTAFQQIPASHPIVPTVNSYSILISALCNKPDLSAALDVITLMEKRGVSPNIISFNTLLNGFYNNDGFDDAEKVWKMMKERNVKPDVKSYNAKLRVLVSKGRLEDAVAVIGKMQKEGPKPDSVSYSALIRGNCNNVSFGDAEKVWEMMKERNVEPDVNIYNAKLRVLVAEGRMEDAVALIGKMQKEGPKPDSESYNVLIRRYCKEGMLNESKKVYDDLIRNGCAPNKGTFETLMPCLVEAGELDLALDCCQEIFNTKCRVKCSLLQAVVTALVAASRVEEARRIVKLGWKNSYNPRHLNMPALNGKDNNVEAETDCNDSVPYEEGSEEEVESKTA